MDIAGSLYPTGRIGTTNYILTPENIVNDMINMLPDDFWTPDIKVLDIFSKSGRFLMAAYKKLFNSPYLADMDIAKRKHHILSEQLYGITDDFTCLMLAESSLYGYAQYGKKNIRMIEDLQSIAKTTDKKLVAERLGKELGGQMEFDLVIGNPPYNNDLYLDFVTVAQHLSSKYTVMITPAKWQAKGGKKNEDFRKNVVPYMSKIVYYPDTLDVFAIADSCGICYYIIDKDIHDECEVTNKSSIRSDLNSVQKREILRKQSLWNVGNSIVEHIGQVNSFKVGDVQKRKKYTVSINTQSSIMRGFAIKEQDDNGKWRIRQDLVGKGGAIFDKDGKVVVLGKITILDANSSNVSGTSKCIFTSDNEIEIKSFVSYINTKLVAFLMLITLNGLTVINNETFRFVPMPGAFDHIFTDEELYKKYNLTNEEINIIESIIKERK